MSHRSISCLALLCALSFGSAGRAEPRVERPHNISRPFREFLKSYDRKTAIAALPKDANQNRYVIVKGLFGNNYPGYMKKNLAALKDGGLSVEYAPVNTAASVKDNAAIIKEMIRATDRPIVFITHSKGTADVAQAIGELHKDQPGLIKDKVRGLVSLQGAYGGSPVADFVAQHSVTRGMARGLTKMLGGSAESVFDLQTSERRAARDAAPMPTDVVPTVSMVGYGTHARSVLGPGVAILKLALGRYSDGLVATQDAVIRGSDVVRVPVDHAKAAFGNHAERLTLGLVRHVLEMPRLD